VTNGLPGSELTLDEFRRRLLIGDVGVINQVLGTPAHTQECGRDAAWLRIAACGAQQLGVSAVTQWLYRAGRLSITAVKGAAILDSVRSLPSYADETIADASVEKYWRHLRLVDAKEGEGGTPPWQSNLKLYVAAAPRDATKTLATTLPVLRDARVLSLKVARGENGLARPDKIVVYVNSENHRVSVCGALSQVLMPRQDQPIPFAFSCDSASGLYGGMDPPKSFAHGEDGFPRSWRAWISQVLAKGLCLGAQAGLAEPWRAAFAMAKIAGVEPGIWHAHAPKWGVA
jgi:hypothetical protein